MTSRVRWEGVDEVCRLKNGPTDDLHTKPSRKRSSIDFICTAVRHFSHHHTSQSSSSKPTEIELQTNLQTSTVSKGGVELKQVKLLDNTEKNNSEVNREESKPTGNEDGSNMEAESLLGQAKENKQEGTNNHRTTIKDSIVPTTLSQPTINDKVTFPSINEREGSLYTPKKGEKVVKDWKHQNKQATVDMMSALYGIMLVVMGMAFPLSQVISLKIPSHYYEGFYAYLYFVAIGFFGYIYILLKTRFFYAPTWKRRWNNILIRLGKEERFKANDGDDDSVFRDNNITMEDIMTSRLRETLGKELDAIKSVNHGSFYLRMGAVVFGVGSMIYSGLEFAQYFEMSSNPLCDDIMMAVQPVLRMLFTFFQMYFIFLNAKIKIIKKSNIILARFGMMHIVATNLCVWLNVIIQETKHEIFHFEQHESNLHHQLGEHGEENVVMPPDNDSHTSIAVKGWLNNTVGAVLGQVDENELNRHHLVKRTLTDECHRSDLLGTLTQNASPFLFPCAIEYSLICAAIMYEIWMHTRENHQDPKSSHSRSESPGIRTPKSPRYNGLAHPISQRRSPHHYSVDCTNANKGLFFGIFILVLSILSMILFFVLIHRDEYKSTAITMIYMSELFLHLLTLVAVLIGMIQVSQLRYDDSVPLDLDNILLIVALTGVISVNVFSIVGTQFSDHPDRTLLLFNSLIGLLQGVAQTVFVLGSSKRQLYTRRQEQMKPGREVVTFLMVTNFAMWAIITLEKSRFDAHPVQTEFFGQWSWTIITNISSPLAIFYRYHSTVCLCEIWKRCYKVFERHQRAHHQSV